jgi:hypothetical protein
MTSVILCFDFIMDQIHAKQVIDVVDKTNDQEINGKKTFNNTTNFQNNAGAYHLVINQGFLYWTADLNNLNIEGNVRMGMIDGVIKLQVFSGGSWIKERLA